MSVKEDKVKMWFLTVDWCDQNKRGIFCKLSDGTAFAKDDEPHTEDEIWDILDCFSLVLSPKSIEFTEEEVSQHNEAYPLAEFSNVYGYAIRG